MDITRVYTKTSKGILEGNTKSRDLTRDHGRVLTLIDGKSTVNDLLEKNSRLSENRLGEILDELAKYGMIRELNGALAVDDLGFSSTIIVGESNTQAFFEAQVHLERELRRAEDHEAHAKEQDRTTLLNEVKADIKAEAEAIKREIDERQTREAAIAHTAAQEAARREAEAQMRRKEDAEKAAQLAAQKAEKAAQQAADQARRDAEAHAKAVAEHARKRLAAETKAREQAEARAQALEVEMFVRSEAARKAKQEAAQRAHAEADAKVRLEAEKKARDQAEKQALVAEQARIAAERKAHEEAAEKARIAREAEEKAEARRVLEAKIQAEEEAQRRATTEARMREMEQDKRRAEEEARALAKALDEARLATELESRVKRRIEARAREEDEVRQRTEAEAAAKLEAETRLRLAAEAQAQAEVEARQQAEAAKIRAEQDAAVQLEAERIARQAAEAQRQSDAARQAAEQRAEAERQTREAAERQAREAAEREAQVLAQATAAAAQREAEAQAAERAAQQPAEQAAERTRIAEEQVQAERLAREQAEREAAARKQAEADAEAQRLIDTERQRVEADARAVAEAEEAVRREAQAVKQQLQEQQRMEEARLAEEAAAREQAIEGAAAEASRALIEARTRAEAEARERESARQQARLDAEAAARAEAEEALQREAAAAEREAAEEVRLRAEAHTRAMAAARGASVFPFLTTKKRKPMRFDASLIKPALIGLLGLVILAVAALHLVPFTFHIPKLERQLSASLGQRVVIRDLHFALYPAPHFKLEGVAIGDLAEVRADTVRLTPSWSSWISDKQILRRVELNGVTISEEGLSALPIWRRHQAQTPALRFEQILVKDAKLANRLLDLFTFDATVSMDRGHFTQAQINSTDQRIVIDITPRADALAIQLSASRSVLPLDPRIQFDDLKITAVARPGSMTLSQIDGQLYGGSLSGNAQVQWNDGWIFTSDLGMRQVDIAPVLALFTQNVKASGVLEAKVRLTTRANTLETLFDAPQVQSTFRLRSGELSGVDFVRAIQSARTNSNVGGKTHFNELSGYMQLANGRYQYRQLKLQTGMMSANGNLEFSSERNLSGNLLGELRTRASVMRTPFILSGTLDTPTLKLAPQRAAPVKPAVVPEAIPEAQ